MKKTLSAMLVVGILLSAVPSSYAGDAPLYLNQKLDKMTINAEKLENLETTHMLSNAFSFLCRGVKACFNFFKKEDEFAEVNKPLLDRKTRECNPCKRARKLCEEGIAMCNETLAILNAVKARNQKVLEMMEEYNRTMEEYDRKYGISI